MKDIDASAEVDVDMDAGNGFCSVQQGTPRAWRAHSDLILGKILDVLEEKGILDRALLIVTSDHGEEFMEHGMLGHATCLHKELVHVPLLMRWPGGAVKGTVKARVGHIDLPPTILDAFDIPGDVRLHHGSVEGEDGADVRSRCLGPDYEGLVAHKLRLERRGTEARGEEGAQVG